MKSLTACLGEHRIDSAVQKRIRQMVQDHKDSGSKDPAGDAIKDMIAESTRHYNMIAAQIETAGGVVPEFGLLMAQAAETETVDTTPETTIKEDSKLPGTWPEKTISISKFFYDKYKKDGWNFKSITQARKDVAEHFSLSETDSGQFRKSVDEAIEYAVVRISRDIVATGTANGLSSLQIFNQLVVLYDNQPNLGTRTSDSVRNQAFSTPSPIAFLANRLAGMTGQRGQIVLEPTAGTGMLLMSASPDSVIANEMDSTRVAILKDQGFASVISGDAMNVKTPAVDIVIANPPFGKVRKDDGTDTVFNVDGLETNQIDQAISLHALSQMDENGKAVLIIGGLDKQIQDEDRAGKYNSGAKRRFFTKLYDTYNVTDHFTIGGELYSKQGAGWPIDIIVISGKGESSKATPGFEAPPIYKTFESIGERLGQTETGEKTNFGVDATRSQQEAANINRGPRTVATGNSYGPGRTGDGPTVLQVGAADTNSDGGRTGSSVGPEEQAGLDGASSGTSQGQRPDELTAGVNTDGREPGADDLSSTRSEGAEGTAGDTGGEGAVRDIDTDTVAGSTGGGSSRPVVVSQGQSLYKPVSAGFQIGTLTPQNMAGPLQNALQRLADKHGSVDAFVQKSLKYKTKKQLFDALSAEQIDAVALALDNIQNRNGFILGDQTGIGKGRVVASMIRYAVLNGKTPVFVTEKQALYADMYRDMIDVGFEPSVADDIMQTNSDNVWLNEDDNVKLSSPSRWSRALGSTTGMPSVGAKKKKIVFSTYDQFSAQYEKGGNTPAPRRRFLRQLVASNDVVLIMDEAHNAGGSGDLNNLRPNKNTGIVPHPRALFFRQIIPLAHGVVYSSATYAKNPEVMDLYSATDLTLGVGGNPQGLAAAITAGGVPFQQITAGMLTMAGQYIRRERSFDGVTYDPVVMDVDTRIAETVSSTMSGIREFEEMFIAPMFEQDTEATGSNAVGSTGEQAQTFTSLMHNIIDQMLLALKVKPSVELAIKTLKAGRNSNEQVVLTVSNTMGAFIDQFVSTNELNVGDEVTARFNDLLHRYLYNTRLYTTDEVDSKGDKVKFWKTDEELGEAGTAAFNELAKLIHSLDLKGLPVSPIDYMLNELRQAGFPASEITGRDFTIDYSGKTPVLSRRDPKDRSVNGRNGTIKQYNQGNTRAIILNRSGSTGISLHASERNPKKGQGKRTMIVVQAEKDINVHMQMLGRVHRTGQVITPGYKQAVANIPAERKPASLLVAKMASLNANTTADADSLFTDKTSVNFLNKYGDRVVATVLASNPLLNATLGYPFSIGSDGTSDNLAGLAKKVTGRLPLLPIAQQELIYNTIFDGYKDLIAELDAVGRNDLEAKTYDLDAKTIRTIEASPKTGNSPFQGAVVAEFMDVKRIGKPFTGAEVKEKVAENLRQGENEAEQARAEFETYRNESLARAQKKVDEADNDLKRDTAEKALTKLQDELNVDDAKFHWLNQIFKVGNTIKIDLKMGDGAGKLNGVVIGKVRKGNPRNPLALSTWRAQIAVADGIRYVSLPFSRFAVLTSSPNQVEVSTREMNLENAAEEFDQALSVSRTNRWIITGNLFTGFSMFQKDNGQIINFTREDGSFEQGVLIPGATFDPQARIDNTNVSFSTFEQANEYMESVGNSLVNLLQSGGLKITHSKNGTYRIITDRTAGTAGRYFRDDRVLLEITGQFTSSSQSMKTDQLTKDQVQQVFELFQTRGNTWFADTELDTARNIVNGPAAATDTDQDNNSLDSGARLSVSSKESVKSEPIPGLKVNDEYVGIAREATEISNRGWKITPYHLPTSFHSKVGEGGDHQGRNADTDFGVAEKIAGAFGKKVIWVTLGEEQQANGLVLREAFPDKVFIDFRTPHPTHVILGHELSHFMETEHPEDYKNMVELISPLIKNRKEYAADKGFEGESDEFLDQEIIGDILGDSFNDPTFWAQVADQSPSKFRKIAAKIRQWITNIIGKFQGLTSLDSEKYVTDLKKAKSELAKLTVKSLSEAGRKEIANIAKEVANADTSREGRLHRKDDKGKSESDQGTDRGMGQGGQASGAGRNSSTDGEKRPRNVTAEDLKSDNFKSFFGNSTVVHEDGTPRIFWFGSKEFGTKDDPKYWTLGAVKGPSTGSPMRGLGFFSAQSEIDAHGYSRGTGNVHGFYIRLENPLRIKYSDLPVFKEEAEAVSYAKRQKELNGYDGIYFTDQDHIVIFDGNQAKSAEINTGDFSRTNNDVRYSPLSADALQEIATKAKGSITFKKNPKVDSTFLDRVLSTPEYYFKKFGAAGRVLQAALLRRDIRHEKETEILGGFVTYIQNLRKTNKKAYDEANEYLIETDQQAEGFRIKTTDTDTFKIIAPLSAVKLDPSTLAEIRAKKLDPVQEAKAIAQEKEKKRVLDEFVPESKKIDDIRKAEKEAITYMINAEGEAMVENGFSKEAIEAIKQARELTNRGFDIMAADMRAIIAEAKENGMPDPFIGDGKTDESGRYGVYAVGKSKPIALFASENEASAFLGQAAKMISYMVFSQKDGTRDFDNELQAKKWADKRSGTVKQMARFQNLKVKKRTDAEMRPLTVKQALAQMGDLRGIFFPRIREPGEYVLIAKKDGENPIRKHFDIPTVGDNKPTLQKFLAKTTPIGREAEMLKAKGFKVEIKKDDSTSEDVFEATNLMSSVDALLTSSLETVNKNDNAEVRAGQHINQILTMQIADIFKSRGYLSSRLKRLSGDVVWEGYETDMGKALTQYGKNVGAGTAKRDTARAMMLAFTGRDYSWAQYKAEVDKPVWAEYQAIVEKRRIDERTQKNLFRDVRSFMIDILRNDEQADRIIGTLKGLAVIKYMGFRVSSAAVNLTNLVLGVPASISGYTGESIPDALGRVISAATAYGQYRTGKGSLSKEDRALFEYISMKGWDEAQFNHEAASELRGKLGDTWNKFTTASMYMFGAAEKVNRATTIFAAYKAVRAKNTTAEESVIWEKAKEISDRAHGVYGKETIPAWARGKYNILRLTYTFQKFSHNYMLNMIDLGFTKKEYTAASYMLLAPAILAGSGATLASPVLFALASALGIGGDDPEEEFYRWAEKTFGGGAFARQGLFGVAGVNIKGSLQMNNPIPTTIAELVGPAGGVVTDTAKGVENLTKGNLWKGVEFLLPTAFGSMSKASREATEGVTTSNYGSVFYGDEPLKADAADAFLRFLSFNPARVSGIREKQWNEKEVAAGYQADKSEIYASIKRLHIQGKSITPEILKEISVYNERVNSSGRPDLTFITPKGIKTMLKRNDRPSKLERMREEE